jgi:hypothetical protein
MFSISEENKVQWDGFDGECGANMLTRWNQERIGRAIEVSRVAVH